MPKMPRLTASEAERRLLTAGFVLMRSKGSHRLYFGVESVSSFRSIAARFCTRRLCATSFWPQVKIDERVFLMACVYSGQRHRKQGTDELTTASCFPMQRFQLELLFALQRR